MGEYSSTLLNLTFQALRELKAEGQQIPALYVVHSRTLMDNPVLDAFNRCGVTFAGLVVGGDLVPEGSAFAVC